MSEANEEKGHSNEGDAPMGACHYHRALYAAGVAIANLNQRPCLVFARGGIQRTDMELIYEAMEDTHGDAIDVLLSSCGGSVEGAYMIARSLRRRFRQVRIYVPHLAKSAATLLSLAADEIVMGPLGELGPMDVQSTLVSSAPVSSDASALLPFTGLKALDESVRDQLRETVEAMSRATGVRPADVVGHTVDMIAKVYAPIYAKLDPARLGEGSRGLRMGFEYAMRILCRMRGMPPKVAGRIVGKLVHAYPSHDFVIDLEEAKIIGLPVRPANEHELPLLRDIGRLLLGLNAEHDLVQLVSPGETPTMEISEDDEASAEEAAFMADLEAEAAAEEAAAAAAETAGANEVANGADVPEGQAANEPATDGKRPPEAAASDEGATPEEAVA